MSAVRMVLKRTGFLGRDCRVEGLSLDLGQVSGWVEGDRV